MSLLMIMQQEKSALILTDPDPVAATPRASRSCSLEGVHDPAHEHGGSRPGIASFGAPWNEFVRKTHTPREGVPLTNVVTESSRQG